VTARQPIIAKSYFPFHGQASILSSEVDWEALLHLSSRFLSATNIQQILDIGVCEAARLLQLNSCAVALWQPDSNLVVRSGCGLAAEWVGYALGKEQNSLSGYVLATKSPAWINDSQVEQRLHLSPLAVDAGLRSGLAVPMLVGEQIIGVLAVYSDSPSQFSGEQVYVLSFIANQTAVALEQMRALDRARQQVNLLEAAIYSAQQYQELLQARQRLQSSCENDGKAESENELVHYKGLADSMSDGLFVIDRHGRQMAVNRTFCEMTGFARWELLGQVPPFPYWPEEDAKKIEATFKDLTAQPEPACAELMFQKKDGTRLPVLVTFVPLWDHAESVVGHIGIVQDIAESQKVQMQLRQVARLASLGELISGVAHELNNPLTVILALSELIQDDGQVGERIRQDLEMIQKQAERSARIVHNVLRFARLHGKERGYISINQLVQETLELMDSQLRVHEIEVTLDLAHDLPWTVVNPHQIQQVFVNIINNADQAMYEARRCGKLTITTRAVGEEAIRIAFTDNGPGIDEETMAHIFEPFFTTRPPGIGTGLGLAVCREIVQEHGGRIWAESKVGQGTTFFVELPVVENGD